jgi:hypothetical protein
MESTTAQHPMSSAGRLKKHSWFITLLGGLIVFSTFVVKEGYRDRFKDVSDSITTAENNFVARKTANPLPVFIAIVYRRIGRLEGEIRPKGKKSGPSEQAARDEADVTLMKVDEIIAAVDNLSALIEKLPERSEDRILYDDIKNRTDELVESKHKLEKSLMILRMFDPRVKGNVEEVYSGARLVQSEADYLLTTYVGPLEKKLIKRAREYKKEQEISYHQATSLSYGLYAVGWMLALVGKLVKDEKSGDESE